MQLIYVKICEFSFHLIECFIRIFFFKDREVKFIQSNGYFTHLIIYSMALCLDINIFCSSKLTYSLKIYIFNSFQQR